MLKQGGLKYRLVEYLKTYKILKRTQAIALAKEWGVFPDTMSRRLRELGNEVGVTPLNDRMKPARVSESETIHAWRWRATTVFKKTPKLKNAE